MNLPNESANKFFEMTPLKDSKKQPLLLNNEIRKSELIDKNFSPSRIKEYEKVFHSCNKTCVINCNKTCYSDFLTNDNEEIKSFDTHDFSSKSIIIFITTLLISTFYLSIYRKFNNYLRDDKMNEYLFEFTFFNWRLQSVLFFLSLYIFISNYFTKNIYIEEMRNLDVEIELDKIHMIKLNFSDLISLDYLKISLVNVVSSFLFLVSTKVLPLGFCLIFNNSGIIFNFIFNKKSRKSNLKFFLFLSVSFMLLIYFINEGLNEFFTKQMSTYYHLGILAIILSSVISFFINSKNMNNLMTIHSPLSAMLIINLNSLLVSSVILFILELITNGSISIKIFGWISESESLINVTLLGFIGMLNIIFTIFSTVYLKSFFIKILKLIEIPFADFIAINLFQMYTQPKDLIYYIVIINFMVTIGIIEFTKIN